MENTIKITLELRPAEYEDFADEHGNYMYGILYFLRSNKSGKFDQKAYYMQRDTDKKEFKKRFKNKMVYVLKRALEYKELGVLPNE